MKITTTCPNCSKDLVITGVRFTFDNPDTTTKPEPLKAKLKGYVGWDRDNTIKDIFPIPIPDALKTDNKETIRVDNTGDPKEDVGKMVKDIVDKTPQPFVDLNKVIAKIPVLETPEPKKEDELIPLIKKLISLLDEKMYPELHTFLSALLGEETIKKEESKRHTAW